MGLITWFKGLFVTKESTVEEKLQKSVSQAEGGVSKVERRLTEMISKHEQLEELLPEAAREVEKWETIAAFAVNLGNKDHLRMVVKNKLEASNAYKKLKAAADTLEATIIQLQSQAASGREQIDEAKINQLNLEARLASAQVRQELAGDVLGKGPFAALDDMEEATVKAESTAQAYEETSAVRKKDVVTDLDVEQEMDRISKR